jgi:hypothetical protein
VTDEIRAIVDAAKQSGDCGSLVGLTGDAVKREVTHHKGQSREGHRDRNPGAGLPDR